MVVQLHSAALGAFTFLHVHIRQAAAVVTSVALFTFGYQLVVWPSSDYNDEVVAAFLETSGRSLKQLLLSKIGQVHIKSFLDFAWSASKLHLLLQNMQENWKLYLSWCTKLTEEELGFVIDNSSSLKRLKIYGCTKIAHDYWLKVTGSHMFSDTFKL
ncbi:leucine-rich repeat domain, L domain-like protein [Tanacetum coccineum]